MKLLRTLRPALARHQVLARQPLTQPPVRIPALYQNRRLHTPPTSQLRDKDLEHASLITPDGLQLNLPVHLHLKGVKRHRTSFPYFWLRDNCRCTSCVNQDTMQRSVDTFKIPRDIHVVDTKADEQNIFVEWSDGHRSCYDWEFIRDYTYSPRGDTKDIPEVLFGAEAALDPPTVEHDHVKDSEDGVGKLTMNIVKHGFTFVNNVPFDSPDATQELLERIAFIRQTHYGGFYDFKPDLAMADTAYTNLALPAHTDTTYFTEPAGLQAFHMLSHEPAEGESQAWGGQSLLVDGFHAARTLQTEDKQAYDILSRVRLPWHASGNKDITIGPDQMYPVLEHTAGREERRLNRIRWNNDDRGVLPLSEVESDSDSWYDAARKWDEIIRRPELQFWFQLEPGKLLIFDNWRVLHGRSAFSGIRRMCGGYINRDDFISRWRNTNFSRKENLIKVRG